MPEISLSATASVANGPRLPIQCALHVEAYDQIEINVPAEVDEMTVELQPVGAGQVQLVAIAAEPPAAEIGYKLNTAAAPSRALEQPHVFIGAGAVSFLDAASPTKLLFSNTTSGASARDFVVQILVGRKAVA